MTTTRPHSPQPSVAQSELIDALGGPKAVAEMVSQRIGLVETPLRPQSASMWKARGIPYRYRAAIAIEARERGIGVPAGFMGEGHEPVPAIPQHDDVPEWLEEGA